MEDYFIDVTAFFFFKKSASVIFVLMAYLYLWANLLVMTLLGGVAGTVVCSFRSGNPDLQVAARQGSSVCSSPFTSSDIELLAYKLARETVIRAPVFLACCA